MMNWLRSFQLSSLQLVVFLWFVLTPAASAVVVVDWVTVGDPGNAGDPQESCAGCGVGTTFGAVAEPYRISKFEVTNAEYAEFLNAVAATDTNTLYNISMGSAPGGITRSGVLGTLRTPPLSAVRACQ